MFQNQQNSARGGQLGGSRLQNGKLGEGILAVALGVCANRSTLTRRRRLTMGFWRSYGYGARAFKYATTSERQ